MERIYTDNIYTHPYFKDLLLEPATPYLVTNASPLSGLVYSFASPHNEEEFVLFLTKVLESLLAEYQVRFFFMEQYPGVMSKIRSYQKLFYQQKQVLLDADVLEYEFPVDQNQSILASSCKLTSDNAPSVIPLVLESLFSHALLFPLGNIEASSLEEYLAALVDARASSSDVTAILNHDMTADAIVLQKRLDGHDTIYAEFYSRSYARLLSLDSQIISPGPFSPK